MNMQNSPLSALDLIALAALSELLGVPSSAAAKRAQPEPAPAPEPKADAHMSLEQMLSEVFGATTAAPRAPAAPFPIGQVGIIPQDIAERCGMTAPDYDPSSLVGSTVSLLASALANLRELSNNCEPTGKAKCQMADQNIGAAIAALGLLEPIDPTTTA